MHKKILEEYFKAVSFSFSLFMMMALFLDISEVVRWSWSWSSSRVWPNVSLFVLSLAEDRLSSRQVEAWETSGRWPFQISPLENMLLSSSSSSFSTSLFFLAILSGGGDGLLRLPPSPLRLFEAFRGFQNRLCVCPTLLSPVCGKDGAQYDNLCQLKCSGTVTRTFLLFLKRLKYPFIALWSLAITAHDL